VLDQSQRARQDSVSWRLYFQSLDKSRDFYPVGEWKVDFCDADLMPERSERNAVPHIQQIGGLGRTTLIGCRIECFQPAFGDRFQPVMGAGEHAGDGDGGVGIATAIDDIGQAILKRSGAEQRLKDGADSLDNIAAGIFAALFDTPRRRIARA